MFKILCLIQFFENFIYKKIILPERSSFFSSILEASHSKKAFFFDSDV